MNGPGTSGELVIKDGRQRQAALLAARRAVRSRSCPATTIASTQTGYPSSSGDLGHWPTGTLHSGTQGRIAAAGECGIRHTARIDRAPSPPCLRQRSGSAGGDGKRLATRCSDSAGCPCSPGGHPRPRNLREFRRYPGRSHPHRPDDARGAEGRRRSPQQQLAGDVQAIEAYNAPILEANDRCVQVLSGRDRHRPRRGPHRLGEMAGRPLRLRLLAPERRTAEQPTVVEQVPLAYQPQRDLRWSSTRRRSVEVCRPLLLRRRDARSGRSDGLGRSRGLRAGDQVLTQDPRTGELKYQAARGRLSTIRPMRPSASSSMASRSSPPASTASGRPARAGPWPATSSRATSSAPSAASPR